MKKAQRHRIPATLWTGFKASVIALGNNPSRREILALILDWTRKNSKLLDTEPFASYGLMNFINLNEGEMPVEHSAFTNDDFRHFKETISKYNPDKTDSIARFIRDTLEELIVIEVDKTCPNCHSDFMLVFLSKQKMELALVCKICGHSNYLDGSAIGEADKLDYASRDSLWRAGLIQ